MAAATPPTILFVDDDEANRHAFHWLLQEAGFAVTIYTKAMPPETTSV